MDFCIEKWNKNNYLQYIKYLEDTSEITLKKFNERIINDKENVVLGIKTPVLRNIAKQILLNSNPISFLECACDSNKYVEEVMIEGFVIASINEDLNYKFKRIDRYIPKITNWAICDSFVPSLKFVKKNRNKFIEYLSKYANSKSEFELRFYIVCLLDYYLEDDTIDFVLEELNRVKSEYYYVKMAIAWTLCDSYIYYPKKTYKFLTNNNSIDKFTFNKAISKMIDSYRISDLDKEVLRKLKK